MPGYPLDPSQIAGQMDRPEAVNDMHLHEIIDTITADDLLAVPGVREALLAAYPPESADLDDLDDDDDPDEDGGVMASGDYMIVVCEAGYAANVVGGRHLGHWPELQPAEQAIRDHIKTRAILSGERQPTVWWVEDGEHAEYNLEW